MDTIKHDIALLCGSTFFSIGGRDRTGRDQIRFLDGGTGINYEQLIGDIRQNTDSLEGFTASQIDHVCRFFYEEDLLDEDEKKLHGIVKNELMKLTDGKDPHPGCYPPGILLASTWNPKAVYDVGHALGLEARMFKIACLLGTPNVNILRDPRNGRFFEGYSEDPYLAGALAKEMTRGVQSLGVAANVKHFAANNLEINRVGMNEIISRRALEEIYLPGFRACVAEGKTETLMSAYNSINGIPCCENRELLRSILRDRWGFEGVTMTDWGACIGDSGDAVAGGTDVLMPGPWEKQDEIEAALNDGRLTREEITEAAKRVTRLIDNACRGGLPVSYEEYLEIGDKACRRADSEGFVLLKNDGLLPLENMGRIRLEGDPELIICGSGSAQVFTDRGEKMKEIFDDNRDGDVSLVVVSIRSSEGTDCPDIRMPAADRRLLRTLVSEKRNIILVLNVPGPVEIPGDILDGVGAILLIYYPGMKGAITLYDMISGRINPSGKLSCTFPLRYEDTPAFVNYPDGHTAVYGEEIFVGYRGYEKHGIKPMFPFGHGLSYTSFELSGITSEKQEYALNEKVTVNFRLKNTGDAAGAQVVQLYVGDPVSKQNKPVKELRAFAKYFLEPGQEIRETLEFDISDIGSYSEDYDKFLVEDGIYDIYVGFSSEDIKSKVSFRLIDGSDELRLGTDSTVLDIMNIPALREILIDDISRSGGDIQKLIDNERYTPSVRIRDIYANATEFKEFAKECMNYLKE